MLACSELDALEREEGSVIKEQAKAVKCAIIVDDPEPFPKTGFYEVCVFYTAHGNCEGPFAGICLPSSGDEAAVSFGVHVEHGSPHNLQLVRPKVLNHMSLVVRRDPVLAEPLAFQVLDAHGNVCSSMTAPARSASLSATLSMKKSITQLPAIRGTSNKHTQWALFVPDGTVALETVVRNGPPPSIGWNSQGAKQCLLALWVVGRYVVRVEISSPESGQIIDGAARRAASASSVRSGYLP